MLKKIETKDVEFEQWKRVEIDGKKIMRVVNVNMTTDEFIPYIPKEYDHLLLLFFSWFLD
jgi:hypothetical protein